MDEELNKIFAPIEEEYDGGDPMLPGTIPEAKRQIMALVASYSREARIEAKIDTYQRLTLWLENQEDNDQLALLSKDISVELDKLFAELKTLKEAKQDPNKAIPTPDEFIYKAPGKPRKYDPVSYAAGYNKGYKRGSVAGRKKVVTLKELEKNRKASSEPEGKPNE